MKKLRPRILTEQEKLELALKVAQGKEVKNLARNRNMSAEELREQLGDLIPVKRGKLTSDKTLWLRDFEAGATVEEIAKKYKVPKGPVHIYLYEVGVSPLPVGMHPAPISPTQRAIDVAAVYLESNFPISLERISQWAGVRANRVRGALANYAVYREDWQRWADRQQRATEMHETELTHLRARILELEGRTQELEAENAALRARIRQEGARRSALHDIAARNF
jgi:hypothetical protein